MPPRENRHGIPDEGPCIRCNFQLEGSGVNADDVVIDAGDATQGRRRPERRRHRRRTSRSAPTAPTASSCKNVKVRHAKEHGIYVLESDGYLLTHFKAYYNGLYGTLTFVEDHGVQQHCDAVGHGDSGIYPGAAVETGEQRPEGTEFRYNQEVRFCDLHHNMAGYSGTNGNAVHVHHNRIYDNALGLQTDVVTGAGHPGYPGDSMLVENNLLLLEQLQRLRGGLDRQPGVPVPGRHRPVDRRRQPPPGPQQLLLRQLAPRDDALQRARPARLRRRPPAATSRPAATRTARRRRSTTASTTTTWACGPTARPTRTAPTSGGTRTRARSATAGGTTARPRAPRSPTSPPSRRVPGLRQRHEPGRERRARATRAQTGELLQLRGRVRDARRSTRTGRARGSRRRPSRSPASGSSDGRGPGRAFAAPSAIVTPARSRGPDRPAQRLQRRLVRGLERGR